MRPNASLWNLTSLLSCYRTSFKFCKIEIKSTQRKKNWDLKGQKSHFQFSLDSIVTQQNIWVTHTHTLNEKQLRHNWAFLNFIDFLLQAGILQAGLLLLHSLLCCIENFNIFCCCRSLSLSWLNFFFYNFLCAFAAHFHSFISSHQPKLKAARSKMVHLHFTLYTKHDHKLPLAFHTLLLACLLHTIHFQYSHMHLAGLWRVVCV